MSLLHAKNRAKLQHFFETAKYFYIFYKKNALLKNKAGDKDVKKGGGRGGEREEEEEGKKESKKESKQESKQETGQE